MKQSERTTLKGSNEKTEIIILIRSGKAVVRIRRRWQTETKTETETEACMRHTEAKEGLREYTPKTHDAWGEQQQQ